MAESRAVWGVEIGLAGLKAIRLKYAEAANQVLAVAFDYVPHAKILSQPDANKEELIDTALSTFLSRNQTKGDVIAISVPGQTALAKFIQLPPVEMSKVVEIVKYEARQQIPFALEEVIWDYQPLGGGAEESGFLLDAEVGLFAMKRDQVNQHLAPYLRHHMEVELIQIAPLALYNYLCHDQLGMHPGSDVNEVEEFSIVLDMGADNTTLLVSNGKKIWNRNVPLGGNHFTRALTKEMKLTFAKAEHLKCNATKSPDPKAIFQALRPVFNDYVAEIQRSIGYFSSVNRNSKIKRILGVGNGFKLAGLQKFLQQNLQMEVERVEAFSGLAGDTVLNAPLFQENMLSFVVPYGLALQGLKITRVHTSLLPPEIKTSRLIRKKKPWAVAAAALLLFGLATSTMGYSYVWSKVGTERWSEAEKKAGEVKSSADSMKTSYDAAVAKNKELRTEGDLLVADDGSRLSWMEVYKAINECLPRDTGDQQDEEDPSKKNRIRIYSITTKRYDDLSQWFNNPMEVPEPCKQYLLERDRTTPPSGAGYVFTLRGRHFHDDENPQRKQVLYVVNTLLKNLQQWTVKQPDSKEPVPVRQLGITHATIPDSAYAKVLYVPKFQRKVEGLPGGAEVKKPAGLGGQPKSKVEKVKVVGAPKQPEVLADGSRPLQQTDFIIKFVWKETLPKDRLEVEPPPQAAPVVDPNAPPPDPNNPQPPAGTPPAASG